MTFGEKVRKSRKDSNISQEELAFQLQVSRQAISKWENDKGYPETEKIIKMSKIFNVTLDYLLNESTASNEQINHNKEAFYVNQEMASGYLLHQTLKYRKMAWAIALLLAGTSFVFLFQEIGVLLYVMIMIASIALFVSILLSGNPYSQLKKEPLLFDKMVKKELATNYIEKRKTYNLFILVSIILFGVSFLMLPLLISFEAFNDLEDMILAISMILAGSSVYLFVYLLGMLQAYRFLGKDENI